MFKVHKAFASSKYERKKVLVVKKLRLHDRGQKTILFAKQSGEILVILICDNFVLVIDAFMHLAHRAR